MGSLEIPLLSLDYNMSLTLLFLPGHLFRWVGAPPCILVSAKVLWIWGWGLEIEDLGLTIIIVTDSIFSAYNINIQFTK